MSLEPVRIAYGTGTAQFGDLYVPTATHAAGTVVIVHGGFWRARYDLQLGAPLAEDLVRRGYVVWNLEYRRVGNGGGWPATFADVATGIDHLEALDVDTARVVAIGHSAGGHLATWAAGRQGLQAGDPGADPVVQVAAVVAQAGVLDLITAVRERLGSGAVLDFMGGEPSADRERWRVADPLRQVPLSAPVVCLHSRRDDEVPIAQSTAYVAAATAAGGSARLVECQGDHYALIDPASAAWTITTDVLAELTVD